MFKLGPNTPSGKFVLGVEAEGAVDEIYDRFTYRSAFSKLFTIQCPPLPSSGSASSAFNDARPRATVTGDFSADKSRVPRISNAPDPSQRVIDGGGHVRVGNIDFTIKLDASLGEPTPGGTLGPFQPTPTDYRPSRLQIGYRTNIQGTPLPANLRRDDD